MSLIAFSLKRRVTVLMCAIALVVFGVVAFTRLPINLLPNISYPSLTVETRYQGAAPAEIESLVSRPVEEAVGVVAGVQRLTSVSRPGLSQVTLEFGWGRDMDFASIDVREKLDLVRLPREAVIRELRDAYVFVANGGVAEKRTVSLGLEEGSRIEALSGVAAGEQVIVAGQGGLKQGSPIKVIPAPEASDLGLVAGRLNRRG